MFEDTFVKHEDDEMILEIPEELIYEVDEGKSIYYRGYREVMEGTKTIEQIMGSSILHAIILKVVEQFFETILNGKYVALTGELGLKFAKKSSRNIDIGVFEKKELLKRRKTITNNYGTFPPKYVIEIDTKAEIKEDETPADYFFKKTEQLLDFGVEKVIWFFTDTQKFMVSEKGKRWEIGDWSENIHLEEDVSLNLESLIELFYQE